MRMDPAEANDRKLLFRLLGFQHRGFNYTDNKKLFAALNKWRGSLLGTPLTDTIDKIFVSFGQSWGWIRFHETRFRDEILSFHNTKPFFYAGFKVVLEKYSKEKATLHRDSEHEQKEPISDSGKKSKKEKIANKTRVQEVKSSDYGQADAKPIGIPKEKLEYKQDGTNALVKAKKTCDEKKLKEKDQKSSGDTPPERSEGGFELEKEKESRAERGTGLCEDQCEEEINISNDDSWVDMYDEDISSSQKSSSQKYTDENQKAAVEADLNEAGLCGADKHSRVPCKFVFILNDEEAIMDADGCGTFELKKWDFQNLKGFNDKVPIENILKGNCLFATVNDGSNGKREIMSVELVTDEETSKQVQLIFVGRLIQLASEGLEEQEISLDFVKKIFLDEEFKSLASPIVNRKDLGDHEKWIKLKELHRSRIEKENRVTPIQHSEHGDMTPVDEPCGIPDEHVLPVIIDGEDQTTIAEADEELEGKEIEEPESLSNQAVESNVRPTAIDEETLGEGVAMEVVTVSSNEKERDQSPLHGSQLLGNEDDDSGDFSEMSKAVLDDDSVLKSNFVKYNFTVKARKLLLNKMKFELKVANWSDDIKGYYEWLIDFYFEDAFDDEKTVRLAAAAPLASCWQTILNENGIDLLVLYNDLVQKPMRTGRLNLCGVVTHNLLPLMTINFPVNLSIVIHSMLLYLICKHELPYGGIPWDVSNALKRIPIYSSDRTDKCQVRGFVCYSVNSELGCIATNLGIVFFCPLQIVTETTPYTDTNQLAIGTLVYVDISIFLHGAPTGLTAYTANRVFLRTSNLGNDRSPYYDGGKMFFMLLQSKAVAVMQNPPVGLSDLLAIEKKSSYIWYRKLAGVLLKPGQSDLHRLTTDISSYSPFVGTLKQDPRVLSLYARSWSRLQFSFPCLLQDYVNRSSVGGFEMTEDAWEIMLTRFKLPRGVNIADLMDATRDHFSYNLNVMERQCKMDNSIRAVLGRMVVVEKRLNIQTQDDLERLCLLERVEFLEAKVQRLELQNKQEKA